MMTIEVKISNVQHIKNLNFNIDLSKIDIACIVSKNGTGKTTIIKSLRNLQYADTFLKTSSKFIFNKDSVIEICLLGQEYKYTFNEKLNLLDSKTIVKKDIKEGLSVELPIPFGDRFNHFKTLSDIDDSLREIISRDSYEKPTHLIDFLHEIYENRDYSNLRVATIQKKQVYFTLSENGYYVREDYLSSGEYFVLNLYKMIYGNKSLIIIDEVDISLDASAQVKLIELLTKLCRENGKKILFTTHSLALIKTMPPESIFYLESKGDNISLSNKSYNYIKSIMFGFKGWDKYILTEDLVLSEYLEYLIKKMHNVFFDYRIVYIGGADNTIDIMLRNEQAQIFSEPKNVIAVLDGDQKHKIDNEWGREKFQGIKQNIHFIPFESIEKDIFSIYNKYKDLFPTLTKDNGDKIVFKGLKNELGINTIYEIIESQRESAVTEFSAKINAFLSVQ